MCLAVCDSDKAGGDTWCLLILVKILWEFHPWWGRSWHSPGPSASVLGLGFYSFIIQYKLFYYFIRLSPTPPSASAALCGSGVVGKGGDPTLISWEKGNWEGREAANPLSKAVPLCHQINFHFRAALIVGRQQNRDKHTITTSITGFQG